MTNRELMQMALELLPNAIDLQQAEIDDHITKYGEWYRPQRVEFMRKFLADAEKTMEALRAALAQPEQEPVWGDSQVTKPEIVAEQKAMNEGLRKMVEQEPVAWRKKWEGDEDYTYYWMNRYKGSEPLYTAPPQREWQRLTDEEILEEYRQSYGDDGNLTDVYFARAIEIKLREKNGA